MRYNVFVSFILGAAIGSILTWKGVEAYYAQLAQEEINSVKEKFATRVPEDISSEPDPNETSKPEEKHEVSKYAKILSEEGYVDYSTKSVTVEELTDTSPEREDARPYVISPGEFREIDEYDVISLSYYADNILADENDVIVEDVEGTVGFESLSHFGEYEDDSVFVRNDRLKVDYEILKDLRNYSDVLKSKPYLGRFNDER